jgi:hypothetical protein
MINVSSTMNILLRYVRSLIPYVIVLPNTHQTLVKIIYDKENSFLKSSFLFKELIHIWSTSSDKCIVVLLHVFVYVFNRPIDLSVHDFCPFEPTRW